MSNVDFKPDTKLFEGGMQGWQCPKCKRIFSPYVLACTYCNEEITNNTGLKEHCINTIYTED